ncbi:MAG: glycosyltransferase [Candidatus Pacebacteria bacterium]|nr:glycosyltransferase [Candidatus Paceibacterota bacterium]
MKILHIINNLGSGGAEKLLEESLPLFNKDNVNVELLLLSDKGNVFDKSLIENNIKINVVPIRSLRNPLNIFYIRQYIVNGGYDIVHVHLFPSLYWTSLASKIIFNNKPKFVFTEHSTRNRRMDNFLFKFIEKFIYSSFDKIILISEEIKENIVNWLNIKNKVLIIENGINLERFISAEPYCKNQIMDSLKESDRLVCMVGRFSPAKDQLTIIRAIKSLPNNIHLLLIGEGELMQKNKDLAKELGVSDRVHFLGFRNDIERIFKTSDIIVLSSNWEGFGLVAVEGMATNKPVIASDVPGLRDVVDEAGLLFKKGDDKELAKIIQKLLSNNLEYERVSKLCFERSKMFDIKKVVKEYENLYKELLTNKKL